MIVDAATLHDLDVLSTSTRRGPTLWSLIDRTRTRAGREQLRSRLVASAASVEEILALQQAHRALARQTALYRGAVDRVDCDALERHLQSNWQLPHSRRGPMQIFARLRRPAWFRQYLGEVAKAQGHVAAVFLAAAQLRELLASADSELLRTLGAAIAVHLRDPGAMELARLAKEPSPSARLAFDQLARDSAKPVLSAILEALGTVEAMWSLGAATAEHGWSYPEPASQLRVRGLYHPFLGRDAVGNDLELNDRTRVCFVTGPNMAGKSTFLKAVGIAVLLAHAGCGVPAAAMQFHTVGSLFSSVQITDNLSAGESFYLAEVRRIRSLAEALQDHGSAVAVLDEPFRGTNVHDAAEATLAVVERLVGHPSALIFVASHLAEVVPAIVADPRVRLLHFSADISGERPRFDYLLRDGMSTQRLGMTLLRQERVLDLLERTAPVEATPESV
jgi:DNA mismatch repair protein MutS